MKFKKILVGCFLAALIICMAGCSDANKNEVETNFIDESRFCIVSEDIFQYSDTTTIVLLTAYDKETKVMYFISALSGGTGRGGISTTVLIDKDGKPLLWEGELK